jgi:lipopolysaccharide export system protein LptA
MRRIRWAVLILIVALVAAVAVIYKVQRARQISETPPPPKSLPDSESARAEDWTWENTKDGKPTVRVRARDFSQNADGTQINLKGVELQMFSPDGKTFDRVRSEDANFDQKAEILYSPGDVEITMAVPAEAAAKPLGRLVVIKTSGVRYESKTGKAHTDKPASFRFDRGSGQSVGAVYDPTVRELQMHNDVKLHWIGDDPKDPPMDIEAGSLLYKEASSEIFLSTWSKFRRDTLSMEGGNAVVRLKEGAIESVDALQAHGADTRKDRKIDYAADTLYIKFNEKGVLKTVTGDGHAKLLSTTATSLTSVNSGRLDMEFEPAGNDSVLRKALAMNGAVVESKPVPRDGVPMADTRVLKSQIVNLYMRADGREMDRVETDSPAHIDFVPNRPGNKRRSIDAANMSILYGSDNQVKTFNAINATTRTENPPVKGKAQPPAITSSKGMTAHFDEKTGAMTRLEQWDDFRYEEGERRAKADRADFHSPAEEIVLLGKARVWDPTGSTDADRITLREKSGEFEALGNVSSTRQPEKKKDAKGGMISGDNPLQAKANRMTSVSNNTLIVYEGKAVLWQGANRITADLIRIDRRTNRLEATGNVMTQLLDKTESKKGATVFTVVRAPSMEYDDAARLAHYRGGVNLKRAGMTVTSRELRAWLTSDKDESSLDRAFADGTVRMVQTSAGRTRTGESEHAEYYAGEGKTVLSEGKPVFTDSVKGTTRGRKITYYTANERFEVEGEEKAPVESKILRKSE